VSAEETERFRDYLRAAHAELAQLRADLATELVAKHEAIAIADFDRRKLQAENAELESALVAVKCENHQLRRELVAKIETAEARQTGPGEGPPARHEG
jgi:hypothetical protein